MKSTTKGSIALIERNYGRGTDYICHDRSLNDEKMGGILVI